MRIVLKVVAAGMTALVAVSSMAGVAGADDPPFVPWSGLLPTLATEYVPSAANDCTAGRIQCVDAVIREMDRRFEPLADACDHDALFSLTYLRTTEEYRRSVADGTFFEDTPFVNHQDAVFARYYFDAYDAWQSGNTAATPPAWRVAFQAADQRKVTGLGNILLGMSAHVNRDLPFVLAEIGLVQPDGSSRKADHDKVNEFLNRVMEQLLAEAAARFDPTVDDGQVSWTPLDETTMLQLLVGWREAAWRSAEQLVLAPTPAARALVAQGIETTAAVIGQGLVAGTAYGPLDGLLGRRAARDSFCSAHHG
jgi:hypothetical protein